MFVHDLLIENLRTFESVSVRFAAPAVPHQKVDANLTSARANVTVLLGNNGAGKTTILRAIALSALSPILPGSGFVPYALVRRAGKRISKKARITGHFELYPPQDEGGGGLELGFELRAGEGYSDHFPVGGPVLDSNTRRWAETLQRERTQAALVVGYGADRRVDSSTTFDAEARAKRRTMRYSRIAGLFEEAVTLVPLSAWLPKFRKDNPGRHKQVINLINQVLPDGQIEPEVHEGEYHFLMRGSRLPFAALSDGYRAFIGWFTDLLYQICLGAPSGHKLRETTGIVLVDEIDLHLHPAWQREVVPRIADALPSLQFVMTTHSPLVVGSLHRENVRVLRENTDKSGVKETIVEIPSAETFGLGAEQLLTGDAFGLDTTRTSAFVDSLEKVASEARNGSADAAVQLLRMMALGAGSGPAPTANLNGEAKSLPTRNASSKAKAAAKKAKLKVRAAKK